MTPVAFGLRHFLCPHVPGSAAPGPGGRPGPGTPPMTCTCVVGLQWGGEAKGKIVDLLTDRHDWVVRYNGGANAAHTVVCNGRTYKPPLLPTGGLRPPVRTVIANGAVVFAPGFVEEA